MLRPRVLGAALLILGAMASPLDAQTPRPAKIPRVGVISERSANDSFVSAFRQGLRELGYIEGQNIVVEYRYAQTVLDRVPALTTELVRLPVDVLVVGGTVSARSARAAAPAVPIVFATVGDPIGAGLVVSLSRPGGNVTGLSNFLPELTGKQLEILKAAQLSRVAVLYNPANPSAPEILSEAREGARILGLELQILGVRQRGEIAAAFPAITGARAGALVVVSDPVFGSSLSQIAKLAVAHRLPAIYLRKEFTEAGGLFAYGPSFEDNYRRVASYVDRILKGAAPGEIPVEQPTKVDFLINAGTAKTLGVTIPPSLLLRADRVVP